MDAACAHVWFLMRQTILNANTMALVGPFVAFLLTMVALPFGCEALSESVLEFYFLWAISCFLAVHTFTITAAIQTHSHAHGANTALESVKEEVAALRDAVAKLHEATRERGMGGAPREAAPPVVAQIQMVLNGVDVTVTSDHDMDGSDADDGALDTPAGAVHGPPLSVAEDASQGTAEEAEGTVDVGARVQCATFA